MKGMKALSNVRKPIFTILWERHLPFEASRICCWEVTRVPLDILCVSLRPRLLYTSQQSLMDGLSGIHLAS